jgi:uncharacterized membrane protein YhaH (DUF805 family)
MQCGGGLGLKPAPQLTARKPCFHRRETVSGLLCADGWLWSAHMFVADLYGSWQGRIGRLTYVAALIVWIIAQQVALALVGHPGWLGTYEAKHHLISLIMFYPGWVIMVKRAHDLGKTGWWVFGWSIIGGIGLVILGIGGAFSLVGLSDAGGSFIIGSMFFLLPFLWQLFVRMWFFAGERGDNRFGPPPQGFVPVTPDVDDVQSQTKALDAIAAAVAQRAQAQRPKPVHPLETLEPKLQKRGITPPTKSAVRSQGFGRRGMKPA